MAGEEHVWHFSGNAPCFNKNAHCLLMKCQAMSVHQKQDNKILSCKQFKEQAERATKQELENLVKTCPFPEEGVKFIKTSGQNSVVMPILKQLWLINLIVWTRQDAKKLMHCELNICWCCGEIFKDDKGYKHVILHHLENLTNKKWKSFGAKLLRAKLQFLLTLICGIVSHGVERTDEWNYQWCLCPLVELKVKGVHVGWHWGGWFRSFHMCQSSSICNEVCKGVFQRGQSLTVSQQIQLKEANVDDATAVMFDKFCKVESSRQQGVNFGSVNKMPWEVHHRSSSTKKWSHQFEFGLCCMHHQFWDLNKAHCSVKTWDVLRCSHCLTSLHVLVGEHNAWIAILVFLNHQGFGCQIRI